MEQPFEKLGVFYLGKEHKPETERAASDYVLYDAKDLTTHAVCVGMTGSGKTGLCIALLEEAGIDGIPAIVVDPKGDLGNLLLTFPELTAEQFRPWIDDTEAARHGQTLDEYSQTVARQWRNGLAEWGQDGDRIHRFRAAVDLTIYTPGSTSGLPLTVLRSFAAPSAAILADADAFRERLSGATAGLLALLGLDADPVRSREFILISNLLDRAWREGRELDIASLIREIQVPPFERVGVLDLDTFFPPKDRTSLAMALNNLLASPSFASWLEGEPLDVQRLLYTDSGQPRISILSIAHLSEQERMFFVTILLNELLSWVRTQAGTPSLRALFYMDEVFGYFPPVANPPSKTPMLTLLKQARAYGLGIVLATQNPVDLDYKGLSNCGTWLLGRLQTERDKARVLDGLEGASVQSGVQFDRQRVDQVLSGLGKRVFLMNNVHEDAPVVFQTRWALSYLRGPLTRDQIRTLMADRRPPEPASSPPRSAVESTTEPAAVPTTAEDRHKLSIPPDIVQQFVAVRQMPGSGQQLIYRPALLGQGQLHFVRASARLDTWEQRRLLRDASDSLTGGPWKEAKLLQPSDARVDPEPNALGKFAIPPAPLTVAGNYAAWQRQLKDHLYRTQTLTIWKCAALKQYSRPGETETGFRTRVAQLAREQRDLQVEKMRSRHASELASIQNQIERAQQRVARERDQFHSQTLDTVISVGSSIFGALLGRKLASRTNVGKASTSARKIGRTARERADIERAEQDLETLRQKLAALDDAVRQDVAQIEAAYRPDQLDLEPQTIRPRKADIAVEPITLAWLPWLVDDQGTARPAF